MRAIVTNHAKERTKERLGLRKKVADKVANKALENGIKHSMAKGNLRKYFEKLYLTERKANNIRIYNRKVYLFKGTVLITVINLPNNLIKAADSIQKNMNTTREGR